MNYDINRYPAISGRIIGEDGKVYNLVDLLKGIADSNGGSFVPEPIIQNVVPETDGATVKLE